MNKVTSRSAVAEIRNKEKKLENLLKNMGRVVVAFSGGVDSSYLLSVARKVLGKKNVCAIVARSPTYTQFELKQAREVAKMLDVNLKIIDTYEMKDPNFYKNPVNRCYWCKRELFSKLKQIAKKENISYIADGSNIDDIKDFRPGSIAGKEFVIKHPLQEAGFEKREIRFFAKKNKLPNWNAPSMACLASRFPYGRTITKKELKKVEKAEEFLKKIGFNQLRVRNYGNLARIELHLNQVPLVFNEKIRKGIIKKLHLLGFKHITVDLEGYRTGSMNY